MHIYTFIIILKISTNNKICTNIADIIIINSLSMCIKLYKIYSKERANKLMIEPNIILLVEE